MIYKLFRLNLPRNWQSKQKVEFFRIFVEKAWSIFYLPMMGKYIENFKHIVLIPCVYLRKGEQVGNFNFYK